MTRARERLPRRALALAAGLSWLGVIAWATLRPMPRQAARVAELSWHCVLCGDAGNADFLLNVILFAPLGIVARYLRWSALRTVATMAALSTAIEFAQGTLIAGRADSLGDVIANAAGALAGWYIAPMLLELVAPAPAFARRALFALLCVSSVTWIATGFALKPVVSAAYPWRVRVAGEHLTQPAFRGELDTARLGATTLESGYRGALPAWPDTLSVMIAGTVTDTTSPLTPASIVSIRAADGGTQLAISELGHDLLVEQRLRGSAWHFHTPTWRFTDALNVASGVRWRFTATWFPDRIVLTADGIRNRAPMIHALSVGMGWVFIHPFVTTVGEDAVLWTVLWIGAWFGMLGWLAGWLPSRQWLTSGAASAAVMAVSAAVAGMPINWAEIVVGLFAFVGGWAAARALRARRLRVSS